MSDVPDEILREILSRLPVAPLLRFRCVSKSWKGLIDNQEFIKQHLNHSRKTVSNLNIILDGDSRFYSADFDLLVETNQANFQELSELLETSVYDMQILGSCDGLLFLRIDDHDEAILWNPSIRRFHEIPCNRLEVAGYRREFFYGFGFGYDFVSDDYKLLSIVQFYESENDEFGSVVEVYCLKSDSWRTIQDFPYYIKPSSVKNKGVLANGALHWTVTRKVKSDADYLIAAFDLGTEEYGLVPLPEFADDDDITSLDAVELAGCLSLMCYVDEDHVDLWVMKEYGDQESWSILFSYDLCDFGFKVWPLAYSECCGKLLLVLDDDVLSWYHLDERSFDVLTVQMPSVHIFEIYACLQSLVLLNSGAHDFDVVVKTKQETNREVLENEYISWPRPEKELAYCRPTGYD